MSRRMAILSALVVVAACGGGDAAGDLAVDSNDDAADDPSGDASGADDGGTGGASTTSPGETGSTAGPVADELPDLPAECTTANELQVVLSEVLEFRGSFPIVGSAGIAVPIVPNGDGSLDDLGIEEFNELGAESVLLAYTQWVGNHPFGASDLGIISGPATPEGGLSLALSVVPTSADGLVTGQTIDDTDEFEFDSITTFSPAGVYVEGPEGWETWFLVNRGDPEQGGSAEVLFVDDEWLCVDWSLRGETRDPEGSYEISGIVLTQYVRERVPFT